MSNTHTPIVRPDPAVVALLNRPDVKEAEFRRLFEDSPVGIAFVGGDGVFLRVNRAYCVLVGYAETELVARRRWQDITHPDDIAADETEAATVLTGTHQAYRMVKRYICKRGRVVTVDLQVDRVDDAAGLFVHFIAHASPIPLNDEFFRVDQTPGGPTIRPFYPLARLAVDNWKALCGVASALLVGAGAFTHTYYRTAAKLEVQQATVDAQKAALDDNRRMVDQLRAEVESLRTRPK